MFLLPVPSLPDLPAATPLLQSGTGQSVAGNSGAPFLPEFAQWLAAAVQQGAANLTRSIHAPALAMVPKASDPDTSSPNTAFVTPSAAEPPQTKPVPTT